MACYAERIAAAQRRMRESGAGALVVGPTDNMRYLTGWAEAGHERFLALVVTATGEPAFVVPAMNAAQARANPAGIARVRGWADETGWRDDVAAVLGGSVGPDAALVVDEELHSVHLLGLQALYPGVPCRASSYLLGPLRAVKSQDEAEMLRRSAAATDAVYRQTLPVLRPGLSEAEVRDHVARGFSALGADAHFALVCFGANSALPHHRSGEARLAEGDVVVLDIGCRLDGYWSDITRTVSCGPAPQGAEQDYALVHAAHRAAHGATRPGVTCESVDAAARGVIESGGCGALFIHRTGHGIGMSCHEDPYIVR
ncbi:MAG TPA: Xaa-Pro peptidase family protein, partial [Chthonomonadales bacterium]|nr:Xaa-Pro peptidase family protein [Chthonomonadales bacterium]